MPQRTGTFKFMKKTINMKKSSFMSQTLKKDPRFVLLNVSLNFFDATFINLCERFYHSIHLWMVMTNCQQNRTHPVMYGKKCFFTHSLFEKYFSNINSSNSSWLSPSSSTFYKKKESTPRINYLVKIHRNVVIAC